MERKIRGGGDPFLGAFLKEFFWIKKEEGGGQGGGEARLVWQKKFKDLITPDQIEELIKRYANLVDLVPPMKAFHWYFSSI